MPGMCALRKGSVRPQGRADCLDGRTPPVCRDANEHNDSIERVPPKIVHRPPAGVLRFRTGRDQDSSLHAVASLRVPNVPACGVLGQPLRGEPFEGEPIYSARSARNIGVGCQLQQNRSRIGGAFAMKWTQRIRNVLDRTADGQRLEHEQTDHRGVFSAFIAHESKATHSRGDDRLPLAQSAHTGQSEFLTGVKRVLLVSSGQARSDSLTPVSLARSSRLAFGVGLRRGCCSARR